jgi:hypothetical protein
MFPVIFDHHITPSSNKGTESLATEVALIQRVAQRLSCDKQGPLLEQEIVLLTHEKK